MKRAPLHRSSQRGAVIIQVAVALLGLLAFSAFVVDYGIMWASRGQAQTSADSGALSAAVSLAFEDGTDFAGAKDKALASAKKNGVFGEVPDITLADITFPACPPGAPGVPDTCVKVDVFRNQRTGGNPLPTFFGNLVGVDNQGVRASATAQVATASSTDCLRPWAVMDKWDEFGAGPEPNYPGPDPDWTPSSTFDRYNTKPSQPPQENDFYAGPDDPGGGTGFKLPEDQGRQFAIKTDSNQDLNISSGWFRALVIPRKDGKTGGSVYRDNIGSCGGYTTTWFTPTAEIPDCPTTISGIDEEIYWAAHGCFAIEPGNKVGPTGQGIDDLYTADADKYGTRTLHWVGGQSPGSHVEDTAHPGVPVVDSTLIVPIGVIDVNAYLALDPTGSNGVVKIVQIYGFFIEGMGDVDASGNITLKPSGKDVIGRIMRLQGTGATTRSTNSTFLRTVMLVR